MHNQLPRRVRRAIVNIETNVSHTTVWGCITQVTYPGECQWRVTGGNDFPHYLELGKQEVSVTSCQHGVVKVKGLNIVEAALVRTEREMDEPDADGDLSNQRDALTQVLAVLRAARQ